MEFKAPELAGEFGGRYVALLYEIGIIPNSSSPAIDGVQSPPASSGGLGQGDFILQKTRIL
jgi:hypothetical protein